MQALHPSPTGTVEDAAALLNIRRTLAYWEARAGRLPGAFRVGRLYRVSLPILYQHLGLRWPWANDGAPATGDNSAHAAKGREWTRFGSPALAPVAGDVRGVQGPSGSCWPLGGRNGDWPEECLR